MKKPKTFKEILKTIAFCIPEFQNKTNKAAQSLKEIADIVAHELQQGREVRLPNIGAFIPVHKPQRQGRNPKTGEQVIFPEKYTLKFKPLGIVKNYADQK